MILMFIEQPHNEIRNLCQNVSSDIVEIRNFVFYDDGIFRSHFLYDTQQKRVSERKRVNEWC